MQQRDDAGAAARRQEQADQRRRRSFDAALMVHLVVNENLADGAVRPFYRGRHEDAYLDLPYPHLIVLQEGEAEEVLRRVDYGWTDAEARGLLDSAMKEWRRRRRQALVPFPGSESRPEG
jgi:hypothetical protein